MIIYNLKLREGSFQALPQGRGASLLRGVCPLPRQVPGPGPGRPPRAGAGLARRPCQRYPSLALPEACPGQLPAAGPLNHSQKFSFCRCQGLHASGNLAFVKDFEGFQQQDNEAGRGGARAAIAVDSWEVAGGYLAVCPGPASSGLCDRAVWSQVCAVFEG